MSRLLIAGASGFIGQALIQKLLDETELSIVALSRQESASSNERLIWKQGDIFSLKDITEAMQGCDQAIYLVHSMLPSASLVQGTFYDMDLILADNFVRAAKACNVRHVLYLSGLIPLDKSELSWHLKSRLEVENCLLEAAPLVTVLRAGMVLGQGGSSFAIMRRLVERLPLMLCPRWTFTRSQPVDLDDLMKVFKECLMNPSVQGKIWDVGGPEVMSYQTMMQVMAESLGKKPRIINVGTFSLNMSRFWVTLVTGAPRALVYPLVLSLRHTMLVQKERQFPKPELLQTDFKKSLGHWSSMNEGEVHAFKTPVVLRRSKHVRSVQRLDLPRGKNAEWVAEEYFRWLPRFFSFIIRIRIEELFCRFYLLHPALTLLLLEKSVERSTPDRQLLYIKGGLLAKTVGRGRLEFREVLQHRYILAAIHDFHPRLPWMIYKWTQAVVHLIVMNAFGRHLSRNKDN